VVENFGTGVVERLGLDYETLREVKPDLVMLSCSGLGRTGPDRDKLAYGTLLQLMAGWSSIQGPADADEVRVGGAWTDPLTAATGAFAILAALHHRRRTGEGRFIDLSMVEATLCGIPEALMDYSLNRRLPARMGNRDPIRAPHGCYPCRGDDRWIAISVSDEAEWNGLRRALGDPPWVGEERFDDAVGRKRHEDELDELLGRWTAERTAEEATAALQAAGVPAGPSLNAAELVNDPHLLGRGVFVETEAPLGGRHLTIGAPWHISPGLVPTYTPAPRLGQDDYYVFKTLLGLGDAEIAELIESRIAH
jgi:crotonobetainyl-CoA:carnitine CoA-transferase CaiB-like acyl-CoA transferase